MITSSLTTGVDCNFCVESQ